MPFSNRVRLPFYLSRPQFPAEEEVYVKANGTRLVLKAIISKDWEGETDWLPAEIHERIAIALRHDTVNVEGHKINTGIRINGSYDIAWQNFLNYPLAKATFRAFQEAYVARNTKCEICEPAYNGLEAIDDYIPGILEPGIVYNYDVSANDAYCCDTPEFTILSVNDDAVFGISIDPLTGVVLIELKDITQSNVSLFTYQLCCGETCDTATVYGSIQGTSGELCPPPENLIVQFTYVIIAGVIHVYGAAGWDATIPPPGLYYEYSLFKIIDGNPTLVLTGTTTNTYVQLGEMDCGVDYRFEVKAVCSEGNESQVAFTTFNIPCTESPTRVMAIKVSPVGTPNGGNLDWVVEAEIVDPAAVTATSNIVITGTVHLSDDTDDVGVPFTITILAGNSSATSGAVGSTTDVGWATVTDAEAAPITVTGSDANEYNVTLFL